MIYMKSENRLMVMGWLSKWSDDDLVELRQLICEETSRREHNRRVMRQEWITRQLELFRCNRAQYQRIGDTIVVSVYGGCRVHMAQTTPIKNDKFDLNTGIAVAYAKAVGTPIPDFI